MIYIYCGSIILIIGVLFLIAPPKRPSRIYGYLSYLAQINQAAFKYAQKVAGTTNVIVGLIQVGLGFLIHSANLDKMIFVWLITLPIFIVMMFIVTESKLKTFLAKRDELPTDYVNPDDRPSKQRTRGFHDR